MATHASSTDITTLKIPLQVYVDAITDDLLNAQAQLCLNLYCDALIALINVNASAAQNYSSGVGTSVTKMRLDNIRENVESTWDDFVTICAIGGQTVATTRSGYWLWDLSGGTE